MDSRTINIVREKWRTTKVNYCDFNDHINQLPLINLIKPITNNGEFV